MASLSDEQFERAIAFAKAHPTRFAEFSSDAIMIGLLDELDDAEHAELETLIDEMGPWRKGPFELFGQRIDANWKSNLKWDRIAPLFGDLTDRTIGDIGCNNGYYMYRLVRYAPRSIVGFEPVRIYRQVHAFLSELHPVENIEFIPRGFDALDEYQEHFDTLLCMGIAYHHPSPIELLRLCHGAIKPHGELIFETLGIVSTSIETIRTVYANRSDELFSSRAGDDPAPFLRESNCLFPAGKYATMKGVWFVPTPGAVQNWLKRSGFRDISLQSVYRYETEQVRTKKIPGLVDALEPDDLTRTVEGYPAPVRMIFTAKR